MRSNPSRVASAATQSIAERSGFTSTVHVLANRWSGARALLPAFPLLARGQPLELDEIARASRTQIDRVDRALGLARCERDDAGRVIELFGLSLTPSLHRLTVDGAVLFSCCALWAHVIPKLVDRTVQVESIDPSSGTAVHLSISPRGVQSAEPATAVASMAIASREAVGADVCAAFCCHVRHFVTPVSAERFAAESQGRYVVDLATLDVLADQLHQAIWSASSTQ